jgi:GNAT superfamily N-acetyltransferase
MPAPWKSTPVTFALFSIISRRSSAARGLYLEDLFVQSAFCRRGYGRALLVHIARVAVERDGGRFEWAVLDWNTPAIGLYSIVGPALAPLAAGTPADHAGS